MLQSLLGNNSATEMRKRPSCALVHVRARGFCEGRTTLNVLLKDVDYHKHSQPPSASARVGKTTPRRGQAIDVTACMY